MRKFIPFWVRFFIVEFVDFEDNSKKFIILGTSCSKDSLQFQDYGRMILLQLIETKSTFEKEVIVSLFWKKRSFELIEISKENLPGIVYNLALFKQFIVCTSGNRILLFIMKKSKFELFAHNATRNFIQSLSCGDSMIMVSDQYDSIILFDLNENQKKLELVQG
jgi:hypothetical protein